MATKKRKLAKAKTLGTKTLSSKNADQVRGGFMKVASGKHIPKAVINVVR